MPLRANPNRSSTLLALCCATLVLSAARAHAWTDTEVVGMSARAEVMPSGKARVSLEIVVDVKGGWVERFELNELGAESVLDSAKPPTWIGADGTKHAPQNAQLTAGRLVLDFGRADERGRGALPRRGTYKSRVVYETWLARGTAPREHLLQLPAWPRALDRVELWIDAPAGSELFGSSDAALEQRTHYERGALRTLHIVRPKLPRARPLEARVVLPEGAPSSSAAPLARPAPAHVPLTVSREVAWLALIALSLIALKRRTLMARFAGRAARPRRTREALLVALCATLCALFGLSYAASPWLALAALCTAVAVALIAPRAPAEGRSAIAYRPAHALDVVRAKRVRWLRLLGPGSWLDATAPCGALLLALLCVAAWSARQSDAGLLWLETLIVVAPLWLVRSTPSVAARAARELLQLIGVHGGLVQVARAHGSRATLEVGRDGTCGHAAAVRVRIGAELCLVVQGPALAWREASGALTLALDPASELAARLRAAAAPEPAQNAA
jgi:hypothetical protein